MDANPPGATTDDKEKKTDDKIEGTNDQTKDNGQIMEVEVDASVPVVVDVESERSETVVVNDKVDTVDSGEKPPATEMVPDTSATTKEDENKTTSSEQPPPKVTAVGGGDSQDIDVEFVILEEDSCDADDSDAADNEPVNEVSERKEKATSESVEDSGLKTESDKEKGRTASDCTSPAKKIEDIETSAVVENDDDDVLILANPLFGKATLPVVDITSPVKRVAPEKLTEGNGEDFSDDVNVENFVEQKTTDADEILFGSMEGSCMNKEAEGDDCAVIYNGTSTSQEKKEFNQNDLQAKPKSKSNCGCDCHEEVQLLKRAVVELNHRNTVLEDFIQVQYGEVLNNFMKQREHLISMGFGDIVEEEPEVQQGKRSAKSRELVELLVMIKEKDKVDAADAAAAKRVQNDSANASKSSAKNIKANDSNSKSPAKSKGNETNQSSSKSKPSSSKSKSPLKPTTPTSRATPSGSNTLNHKPSVRAKTRQSEVRKSRDRSEYSRRPVVNPAASSSYNTSHSTPRSGSGAKQRIRTPPRVVRSPPRTEERKRKHSSGPRSEPDVIVLDQDRSFVLNPWASKVQINDRSSLSLMHGEEEDEEIGGVDTSPNNNPVSKRICPICSVIVRRVGFKDHLLTVHQQIKWPCPSCNQEFPFKSRLKAHMNQECSTRGVEFTSYIAKLVKYVETHLHTWLLDMQREAQIPTAEQVEMDNKRKKALKEAKAREAALALQQQSHSHHRHQSSTTPSGTRYYDAPAPAAVPFSPPDYRNFSQAQDPRNYDNYYGNSNSRSETYVQAPVTPTSGGDHYGSGYAQYAARYLQERSTSSAATGSGRYYHAY